MKVEQALQKIENQIEDEQYEPLPNWNENLVSSIIESFRTLQFYLKKKQTGVVPSGSLAPSWHSPFWIFDLKF